MRLGIFGGSFDPVHNAHLIVARLAIEQLAIDRVHFVVAGAQPFKQGRHGATASHRLRMVELAVAGIDGFIVDGRELARPGPSFTVDTLRELHGEFPAAELILLMGADVAATFSDWHDPEGVRALAQIAVCRRPATSLAHGDRDPAPPVVFEHDLAVPAIEISSTEIRARAAAGRSLAGWVPSAVADYIVASRIYRSHAG